MDRTVAFYTLGCKLNFAETSTIARTFEAPGTGACNGRKRLTIYVINTCTVTDNADKRFRYLVHGILKRNPEAYIIAVGCYAQTNPDEISRTGGVDLVLGAKDKFKITEYLSSLEKVPALRYTAATYRKWTRTTGLTPSRNARALFSKYRTDATTAVHIAPYRWHGENPEASHWKA